MNLFYPEDPMVKVAYRKLLDSVINFPSRCEGREEGEADGLGYSEGSSVGAAGIERSSHLLGES